MLLKIRDCLENLVLKIRFNFFYVVFLKKLGLSLRRYFFFFLIYDVMVESIFYL